MKQNVEMSKAFKKTNKFYWSEEKMFDAIKFVIPINTKS